MAEFFITAGALAMLSMEVFKFVLRRYVPGISRDFDFPALFYELGIPLITFLWDIVLGLAELAPSPEFTTAYLVRWILGVLVAFASYFLTIAPIKEYAKYGRVNN